MPHRLLILVVEDELLVRMDAVEMLEGAGFRTIEAESADQAVEILNRRSDIDIVFTDIQMPGSMDGLKLAAAIRQKWPPIKLILTSGRHGAQDFDLPTGAAFLPKPYDWNGITSRIRQVLA